jgi:streptomycin 6-kinase
VTRDEAARAMVGDVIELAQAVRAKAALIGCDDWVAGLPDVVARLAERWGFVVERSLLGGTEAAVAAVRRHDGTPAVLKVLLPQAHSEHELTALEFMGGRGAVAVFESDRERLALLLEALGPTLSDAARPLAERLTILCDAAMRCWTPVPASIDLPTGEQKAAWLWQAVIEWWDELDRPCSEAAFMHGLAAAERRRRGHDDERAVLVHGDVHQWNALAAVGRTEGGYVLVDPDGLHAEPEYDLGVLMREDPVELMTSDPWQRARWLAARSGLDAAAIWEWGAIERVSTGLLLLRIGLEREGREMLAAADHIAALDPMRLGSDG